MFAVLDGAIFGEVLEQRAQRAFPVRKGLMPEVEPVQVQHVERVQREARWLLLPKLALKLIKVRRAVRRHYGNFSIDDCGLGAKTRTGRGKVARFVGPIVPSSS